MYLEVVAYSQTLHPCVESSSRGDDDLKAVLKKLNAQFRGDVLLQGGSGGGSAAPPPSAARESRALSAKLQEALQLHSGTLGAARRGASCAEHCALSSQVRDLGYRYYISCESFVTRYF